MFVPAGPVNVGYCNMPSEDSKSDDYRLSPDDYLTISPSGDPSTHELWAIRFTIMMDRYTIT
jgi:hypothetical protein